MGAEAQSLVAERSGPKKVCNGLKGCAGRREIGDGASAIARALRRNFGNLGADDRLAPAHGGLRPGKNARMGLAPRDKSLDVRPRKAAGTRRAIRNALNQAAADIGVERGRFYAQRL